MQQRKLPFVFLVAFLQTRDNRAGKAVSDARGVRQEMPKRHRSLRRPRLVRTVGVELRDDLELVEAGQVLGDGIIQL